MAKVLKKESVQDRINKIERGVLGLKFSGGADYGVMYEDKRNDFQFPQSIATFQYMAQHPVIAASNNLIDILIGKRKWEFTVPDDATGKQREAARMLNFFMNDMDHTWKQFIQEVLSYKLYGFHVAEKVFKEITPKESKKFSGKIGWKKLATRSQSTIQGWTFDENVRELRSIKQSVNNLTNIYNIKTDDTGLIDLPIEKCILFSYRQTRGNPEGWSLLKDCYQSWTLVKNLETLEVVGKNKQLCGVPVMGMDAQWLAKAQDNPTSNEAAVLQTLQTNMENLHLGESTYMIVPLAYTDTGKPLFDFKLLGVDGSAAQDNTREIIIGKHLEMLMVFLTDILMIGSTNHGSFSLAESKENLTAYGVENHLQFIVDTVQEQLVKQTLQINGFDLPEDQYPVLTYSDITIEDIDQLGKLVQRLASTNMIPRSLELVNEVLERAGFHYKLTEGDVEPDREYDAKTLHEGIFTQNESGASEGMEQGLPGGTGRAAGNNSALNLDNAS
jgi:hypothetical protein